MDGRRVWRVFAVYFEVGKDVAVFIIILYFIYLFYFSQAMAKGIVGRLRMELIGWFMDKWLRNCRFQYGVSITQIWLWKWGHFLTSYHRDVLWIRVRQKYCTHCTVHVSSGQSSVQCCTVHNSRLRESATMRGVTQFGRNAGGGVGWVTTVNKVQIERSATIGKFRRDATIFWNLWNIQVTQQQKIEAVTDFRNRYLLIFASFFKK